MKNREVNLCACKHKNRCIFHINKYYKFLYVCQFSYHTPCQPKPPHQQDGPNGMKVEMGYDAKIAVSSSIDNTFSFSCFLFLSDFIFSAFNT